MARRIALVLEYEGTAYSGFQLQRNAPSIQGAVEEAIERMTGAQVRLAGAGRTDAGVHAIGQVAAFDTDSTIVIERFVPGLTHFLPDDIAVVQACEVEERFDPRRDAVARVYRYTFQERRGRSPVRRRLVHQVAGELNVASMAAVAASLEGERDFAPFCGPHPQEKSTVRRMHRAKVWRTEEATGNEVHLELEANAFLPQQVRRVAAAVLEVGQGDMAEEAFLKLVKSGVRGAQERVLPPTGLCLRQVRYGPCGDDLKG